MVERFELLYIFVFKDVLRLLDTYASKIAKISDLKTFWPLIQLITSLNVQKLQIFAIFEA